MCKEEIKKGLRICHTLYRILILLSRHTLWLWKWVSKKIWHEYVWFMWSIYKLNVISQQEPCKFNKSQATSGIGSYIILAGPNETALRIALATIGPVATTIDGSSPYFRFYHDGVLIDGLCSKSWKMQNHSVLVVGYGTTKEGDDYWIIKNRWVDKSKSHQYGQIWFAYDQHKVWG